MNPSPVRVGLIPHPERPDAQELAVRASAWLESKGVAVCLRSSDAATPELAAIAAPDDEFRDLDVAISLGGDGTMLRTVGLVYESDTAVLGVNLGRMGYLTEVEPDALDEALRRLLEGDYEVDERMVLDVTVTRSRPSGQRDAQPSPGRWWALNEAVLEKPTAGRSVRVRVTINGTFFTSYEADGMIVSTPTGSTAYSFSARGPIVSPRHRCLLLTPVSPHMLFDRSLVFGPEETLEFTVDDERAAVLIVDGQEMGALDTGDSVTCTGGRRAARIITFGTRDFHQILKAKFGLSDR
jgi:NAD+ kinase